MWGYLLVTAVLFTATFSYGQEKGEMLEAHFINVDYGDAIFLILPDKSNILIDTGSVETAERVIGYLKDLNINKIDKLILTHSHYDHFGGIINLSENFIVDKFFYNGEEERFHEGYPDAIAAIKEKAGKTEIISSGKEFKLPEHDFSFHVLFPKDLSGVPNDDAMVSLISYKKRSILLTSDCQKAQQEKILKENPELKDVDAIQIPHHGGKISDSFAEIFKGKNFILSTGTNRYDKPFEDEIEKLEGKIYRTDRDGNIVIATDGEGPWSVDGKE